MSQHGKHEDGGIKCKIIGVGGAGCNAVKQLNKKEDTDIIDYGMDDRTELEFYAIDTDNETLKSCNEITQIQIGATVTQGQGTGGSLELGRRAAAENMDDLHSIVSDSDMLFIIAGMGGVTGTAVAPVLASLARVHKKLTVCIATRPLDTEEKHKKENADEGLSELQEDPDSCADAVIVVPNQQILDSQELKLQMSGLFQQNNEILVHAVSIILDLLVQDGEINVDFDDIQSLLSNQGTMLLGIGKAKGENRARIAAKNAVNSLLIQENTIESDVNMLIIVDFRIIFTLSGVGGNSDSRLSRRAVAIRRSILQNKCKLNRIFHYNIYSPRDFTMHELDQTMRVICEKFPEAQPMFGLVYKDELEKNDELIVTIISSCAEKQETSTPSIPPQVRGKTPIDDHEAPSSSDPDSLSSQSRDLFNILINDQQIPESVQLAIDNSISAVIHPNYSEL